MIIIIAAMDLNRHIGMRGIGMPWNPRSLKDDMKRFRALTVGHTVIYGRKTLTDDLRKPLPDRRNIVLSRDRNFHAQGCDVYTSLELALEHTGGEERVCILGGAEVYAQALKHADEMHITQIRHEFEGDVFFPEFDVMDWDLAAETEYPQNERNAYPFTVQRWRRKE